MIAQAPAAQHYPLAWQDRLAIVIDEGRQRGPKAERDARQVVERFLSIPANQYRPLPQARRFHQSRKRIRISTGGNRSSKSMSLCQEVFWLAAGYHPWREVKKGQVGFYVSPSWELVGTILFPKFKALLAHMVPERDYVVIWHNRGRDIPAEIHLRTGDGGSDWKDKGRCSKIIFKSMEQGSEMFQGVALDFVAIDEQVPQAIWNEINSRVGAGQALNIMAAFTPIVSQPWLEEKLTVQIPDSWDVFEFPLDDNRVSAGGFIPDELIDSMIAEWPEEIVPTRRFGKWGSFLGSVYKSFSREVHVVPAAAESKFLQEKDGRCIVPPQLRAIGGVDWGGANPLAFLWAVKLQHMDGAYYVFDEYYWDNRAKGLRLLRDHAKTILRRTTDDWKTVFARVYADHDSQDRFEFENAGIPSVAAKKDVRAGIESVQTLLKVRQETNCPRLFIAERCRNLIREMLTYHWQDGTERRDPKDEPVKLDDHCADILRYLCFGEEQSVPSGKRPSLGPEFARQF